MDSRTITVSADAAHEGGERGTISVVITTYNSAAYLPETLRSVFAQTRKPREVIVVDDGSYDDTPDVARALGAIVIQQPNSGPSAARNNGIRAAGGEYVALLDGDDLWPPEKLEMQFAALEAFGRPAFSFTDYREFDERGLRNRASELRRYAAFRRVAGKRIDADSFVIEDDGVTPVLYESSYIAPSTLLVRRADVLAIGGFDETLWWGEDYDLSLRLFRVLPAVVLMNSVMLYRKHGTSQTVKNVVKPAHLDVAQRVAAAPGRYPRGDVRYIARTGFLRHFRLGMQHARYGQFERAAECFQSSLADRWTLRAAVFGAATDVCRSSAGRAAFDAVRTLWKRRPGKR